MKMKPPVFIVGVPRSGTTLLYHMLLSSGGFVVIRWESHVFNLIALKFRNLKKLKTKQKLMSTWAKGNFFRLSELNAENIKEKILSECNNAGEVLKIIMESIAEKQNVNRWADCTPDHLLYMREIKESIPDALFIHIIRDGKDTALSLNKTGWIKPFPWDRNQTLYVTGLRWAWMVRRGREIGRQIGSDYLEIHFEDLLARAPHETLLRVGEFIDHDIDCQRIQSHALGSIRNPNTSFRNETQEGGFYPIGRWRKHFSREDLRKFESLVGNDIKAVGYELQTPEKELSNNIEVRRLRNTYEPYYYLKHWIKTHIPFSGFLMNTDRYRISFDWTN